MTSKKAKCYEHMDDAYDEASDFGRLFVPARQMYYAVRRLTELGGNLDDHQFMSGAQSILNCYLREHQHTDTWRITRDPRGVFTPPHGGSEIPLGTIAVDEFLEALDNHDTALPSYLGFSLEFPKAGPGDNFSQIVYVEKEGFGQLIASAGLQERHDLAVCSSKGYSNDATLKLLLALHERYKVPVFVVHDFDKDGINIAAMIEQAGVGIIDFGLRWNDVIDPRWGLQANSEPVSYTATGGRGRSAQPSDPRPHLRSRGATQEEIDYLCSTARPKGTNGPHDPGEFSGRRVELNALVGRTFIDWLEAKLVAHGVGKVVPDTATLELAFRRAYEVNYLNEIIEQHRQEARDAAQQAKLSRRLHTSRVSEALAKDPTRTWDEVVESIVVLGMP